MWSSSVPSSASTSVLWPRHGGRLSLRAPLVTLVVAAVIGHVIVYFSPTWVQMTALSTLGLLIGATLLTARRWRPVTALAAGGIAMLSAVLGGSELITQSGVGLAVAVQALLTASILSRDDSPGSLTTAADFFRWLAAGTIAPLAGVATLAGAQQLIDQPVTLFGALAVGTSWSMSTLLITPLFLRLERAPDEIGLLERSLQWATAVTTSVLAFALADQPVLVLLVLPVLAWGALRLSLRDLVLQLGLLGTGALLLAALGLGPMAFVDASADAVERVVLLDLFLITGTLLALPYGVVVHQMRLRSAEAHREHLLVERILAATPQVAIIGTDRAGRITMFNPGAENLLGYRADEVLHTELDRMVPRAELARHADELGTPARFVNVARALTLHPAAPRDWKLLRRGGELRNHSMTVTAMTDERDRLVGYVCTSEDVTARVQRQDALLAALISEREAVQRLEQADEVKDALVSTVSHELRTPLTSILGYTSMLADGIVGDLPPQADDMVRRILNNGKRLRALVEDLLVLARINSGHLDIEATRIDLREVVEAVHQVVLPLLETRELDVRMRLPDVPAWVDGDVNMLQSVALNLVSNAIKFTRDGGRITITLAVDADEVVLDVTDTGLGIPLDEQDQLFEQFFRSSIAKREEIQGTGLGLSICRAIVQEHGGVIGATSEPGTGSTFLVVLPAAGRREVTADAGALAAGGAHRAQESGGLRAD